MGLQPKINGKTVERAYEDYRNGIYLHDFTTFINASTVAELTVLKLS